MVAAVALSRVLLVVPVEAFSVLPIVTSNSRCRQRYYRQNCCAATAATADGSNNNSEELQVQATEALILSLSFDADDASRRNKLARLFEEKLQNRDDSSESFVHLFNQVLIIVGDRVRMEAATAAAAAAAAEKETTNDDVDEEELPSFPLPAQKKSQTELQLWALIDMMVQSKTLVRKAAGQLGSEGSFG